MNYEPLPTDTEDSEVIAKARQTLELLKRNLYYIKSRIVEQNRTENKYTRLVITSKAKQLELTEKYSALAEKYHLLSDKYSDLMDKHIALKEQHDSI